MSAPASRASAGAPPAAPAPAGGPAAPAPRLSGPDRLLLALATAAQAAMYVLSFDLVRRLRWQGIAALGVATAAALAWLVFAPLLLVVTRGRPSAAAWLDACLRAAAAGTSVLIASVILNVAAVALELPRHAYRELPLAHAAVLLLADLAMGVTFLRHAGALGVRPARAAALWVVGFNGAFALALWLSGLHALLARFV